MGEIGHFVEIGLVEGIDPVVGTCLVFGCVLPSKHFTLGRHILRTLKYLRLKTFFLHYFLYRSDKHKRNDYKEFFLPTKQAGLSGDMKVIQGRIYVYATSIASTSCACLSGSDFQCIFMF